MGEWREMSPAEVLAAHVVLSVEQVAYVLGMKVSKGPRAGDPDAKRVLDLVTRHKLRPVDGEQPSSRWTFSTTLVRAYIDDPTMIIVSRAVA